MPDSGRTPESPAARAARHAKIVAALSAPIPAPYRPPPKPRATYRKLRPGDRLRLAHDHRREGGAIAAANSTWQVASCDSEGMDLACADGRPWTNDIPLGAALSIAAWRWQGPWEATFVRIPRPRTPRPTKLSPPQETC